MIFLRVRRRLRLTIRTTNHSHHWMLRGVVLRWILRLLWQNAPKNHRALLRYGEAASSQRLPGNRRGAEREHSA